MYYEVVITPGINMWRTTVCDGDPWDTEQELLDAAEEIHGSLYELGVDALPEGIDDIRGLIHVEPERIFAGYWNKKHDHVFYFGITEG